MMASTIRHLMCWILLTIRSRHVMYTSTLLLLNYQAIFYAVGFCQSKTALFDWTFFRLNSSGPSSYRQSSRFYSCCALPRGGWCEGVLLYSRRNRLAALFFALSPRATARRTLAPASWWLFSLVAAWDRYRALLPSCDTRCWRAELGMRHADLLREATVIATPASTPCVILQCGTWYGCVAVWPCGCVVVG